MTSKGSVNQEKCEVETFLVVRQGGPTGNVMLR